VEESPAANSDDESIRVIVDMKRQVPGMGCKSQEQKRIVTIATTQVSTLHNGTANIVTRLKWALPVQLSGLQSLENLAEGDAGACSPHAREQRRALRQLGRLDATVHFLQVRLCDSGQCEKRGRGIKSLLRVDGERRDGQSEHCI
jgi:hypothetical protein